MLTTTGDWAATCHASKHSSAQRARLLQPEVICNGGTHSEMSNIQQKYLETAACYILGTFCTENRTDTRHTLPRRALKMPRTTYVTGPRGRRYAIYMCWTWSTRVPVSSEYRAVAMQSCNQSEYKAASNSPRKYRTPDQRSLSLRYILLPVHRQVQEDS